MNERLKMLKAILAVVAVALPLMATIAGSAWLVASSIADVRTDIAVIDARLTAHVEAVEVRLTALEADVRWLRNNASAVTGEDDDR